VDILKEYILSLGADIVGYADLSAIPSDYRSSLPYGISIGIALNSSVVEKIPSGTAILEYSNEYESINTKLDQICVLVSEFIQDNNYHALPQTISFVQVQRSTNGTEYIPGRALLPHKTVAAISGIGWISKSSLLITPQYGSALRLTSVLTDMPLDVVKTDYQCKCGECTLCIDACPGNVIKNRIWDVAVDRDDLIDFSACRKVTLSRGKEYGRTSGTCGICVAVCPYTRKHLS